MSGRQRVQKVMVQPIGFDEYMNIVLDDAEEVYTKKPGTPTRRRVGQILLKGDNITLIQMVRPA